VQGADALGPQPDLAGGLLAGDVEHGLSALRCPRCDVEQQRGLPRAWLARDQHDGAGDEPAAEHPVELRDAGGLRTGGLDVDLADRLGRAAQ